MVSRVRGVLLALSEGLFVAIVILVVTCLRVGVVMLTRKDSLFWDVGIIVCCCVWFLFVV